MSMSLRSKGPLALPSAFDLPLAWENGPLILRCAPAALASESHVRRPCSPRRMDR